MESALIDGLVSHCQAARFTGILRMRAREGIGEVWFLSGITDEVQFGVSTADEAMDRMRRATEATYELVSRLPHPSGGFKRRFPAKGSVATATPVTLMRYCERYALTCTLAVETAGVLVEARYELGDLVSVETTADDDGITAMLEAEEGTYEFTLPRVELPEGTPVLPPASSSLMESMAPPESLGFRALLEAKPGGRPASDEAEVKRKTVELASRHKIAVATPRAPEASEAKKPVAVVPRPQASLKAEPKESLKPAEPEAKEPPKPAEPEAPTEPEAKEPEAKEPEAKELEAIAPKAKEPEAKAPKAKKRKAKKSGSKRPAATSTQQAASPARDEDKAKASGRSWTGPVLFLLAAAAVVYLIWSGRI